MNRVIYVINARPDPFGNRPFPYIEWETLPLRRFQEYANDVGADFIQIKEDKIPYLCLPTSLTGYQCANMLKFSMLDHFVQSNYDQMLYLDLDILIKENARDIFYCIQEEGIHMMTSGCESQKIAHSYWNKHNFKCEDNPLYNGGIIYADRNSITNFYKNIPQLGQWIDYYKKYNLDQNTKASNGIEFNEQNWMSYFFYQQKTTINEVDENWNSSAFHQTPEDDFVHYYGPAGKYALVELERSPKESITFCR